VDRLAGRDPLDLRRELGRQVAGVDGLGLRRAGDAGGRQQGCKPTDHSSTSATPALSVAIWPFRDADAKRGSTPRRLAAHHAATRHFLQETARLPARFDDIEIGQVVSLGAMAVDPDALAAFIAAFTPGWTADRGAPDAMVYAMWARLDAIAHTDWPQTRRLGVDALRWMRSPPAGELLRGRMTIMAKDPVGEGKGIVICQHDLLDEAGRLVFSCLTRSVFAR